MKYAGILLAAALVIGASGLSYAYAQETIKGKVASVDEATGKISIQISGTTGAGASMAPTPFKVQDGLIFNAIKPGDRVSITTENVNGVPTIKSLKKE
jgi:Cu/Ag efflux protein CusF